MLIDTHCHLNILLKYQQKTEAYRPYTNYEKELLTGYVNDAAAHKITTLINVGTNYIESKYCIDLAGLFSNCYATIGIHPTDIDPQNFQKEIKEFEQLLTIPTNKIVAIGECGIDLYHQPENFMLQEKAFKTHIELALKHKLPLVVHSRNAAEETLKILQQYQHEPDLRGTMHCFSYDLLIANEVISLGFMLGIDAPITYPKNESLREVVLKTSLDHIILETDTPFLPPQSMRGKINTPNSILTIAQYIADLKMSELEEIATKTTTNAKKLFAIP